MKCKLVLAFMLVALLGTVNSLPAFSASPVQIAVNGETVAFPDAVPFVEPGTSRTMVPARFLAEALGLSVKWNEQSNQVTLKKNETTILLSIGQNHALVNGKSVALDAPAVIRNGRTMVPLRFIGEALDAGITWDAERNLVNVTTPFQQGTWIWDAALIQTEPDKILAFASENQVTSLYLQFDKSVPSSSYEQFIRKAKEKQMEVEALAGRPQWALPAYQDQIRTFISWVKAFNEGVEPDAQFAGLHFDIEPYLLPEWKTNQQQVTLQWMDNMRLIEREAKASGMKLSVDVPFWLPMVKVPGTSYSFSAWLLEKVDTLVIMDYRNTALGRDGIVANANAILREAHTLKKKVIIAVETAPNSEGDFTSFYESSTEAMKTELQIAREQLSRFSSFAGFAVHDYTSWAALTKKSERLR
ncbi:copper amine oxidase N-terminal domain-containing protein [Brevibacillus nitrificans]|nr:copper amine oxidase N-terminal domain-containing protein [Brevibacillus nitrificans]